MSKTAGKRIFGVLAGLAIIYVMWSVWPSRYSTEWKQVGHSQVWKDFELENRMGQKIQLSQYKGQRVILNFWATWCPPCLEELPGLVRFSKKMASSLGLVTLAVSVDESWQKLTQFFAVQKYSEEMFKTFFVLLDAEEKVARTYGVEKYPETFFIDRNQVIKRHIRGPADWNDPALEQWVQQNL